MVTRLPAKRAHPAVAGAVVDVHGVQPVGHAGLTMNSTRADVDSVAIMPATIMAGEATVGGRDQQLGW